MLNYEHIVKKSISGGSNEIWPKLLIENYKHQLPNTKAALKSDVWL